MENNMLTKGNMGKGIVLFIIPLVASSLVQQLYSTVDLIIVGQYLGTESSASIGASNLVITCLIGFFNGMAVGTGVITAHAYGSQDNDRLKQIINTSILIGIIGGVILMMVGVIFAPSFLKIMNTPQNILNIATKYLRIYMLSMISIVIYNLCSGIVRSLGDSKTPMLLQIGGGIINIVADIIFIIFFKMGVEGAAIATFLSQSFVAILIILYLIKLDNNFSLKFKYIKLNKHILRDVLKIGVPAGIQSIAITLSNIIIQANINNFGVEAIAAFTAYFKIELILYIPIVALGQAAIILIGQNIGAKQYDRVEKGLKYCIIGGIAMTVLVSCILLMICKPIFNIFSTDMEVIYYGAQIVKITFPFYFLYVILECMSAAIRAMGKAISPMIIILISFCGIRILILKSILNYWKDLRGIAYTYPISWAIAALFLYVYYKFLKEKFYKSIQSNM